MRTFRLLLLGLALLWAQLTLAGHGIEHAFHEHDEACVECLVLPGFASVPALPPRMPCAASAPLVREGAVPPAPTFTLYPAYRSRAPPELQY
jgi:hypothetical protein